MIKWTHLVLYNLMKLDVVLPAPDVTFLKLLNALLSKIPKYLLFISREFMLIYEKKKFSGTIVIAHTVLH